VTVWGKTFDVAAGYCNKKLAMIDFVWVDGVAKKTDWSATEGDLVKERKTLSKMIVSEAQQPCVSSTIGADTLVFNWERIRYGPICAQWLSRLVSRTPTRRKSRRVT
jgi:hypothetical protein